MLLEVFTVDENFDEIFIERLKNLIKESDLSYEKIAEKLGFQAKSTIFKYAHGQTVKIGPNGIAKIARFFEVSPDWLAGFTDDKYYNVKKKDDKNKE